MEPPRGNPFVAAPSISLTQGLNDFQVSLAETEPKENRVINTEKVFEAIVSRAARDVDRYPASARAHFNLGIALLNNRHQEDAVREFEAALKLDKKNYPAAINLARVRVLHEEYEDAKRLYEDLSRQHADNPALLMSLAWIAMRHEEFDKAESLLRRVVGLDERAAVPRYHLAIVFLKKGKTRDAISQLKIAARSDVRSPAIHQALGIAYAVEGDSRRAINSLKAALALAPTMREALHALAILYLRWHEPGSAVQLLTGYTRKEGSEDRAAREMLAQAYEDLGRIGDARTELLDLLESLKGQGAASSRERSLLMNNIGALYASEKANEKASEWIARAIKLCPDADPVLYTNLAKTYLWTDKPEEAWQVLIWGRKYFAPSRESRTLLAVSLHRQGRNEEAVEELADVARTGDADAEVYADLGWILVDGKRDVESAIEVLEEGYQRFRHHPKLVNNLAYTYLLHGEPQRARKLLESLHGISGNLENRVTQTATWGLLRIWEGALEEGISYYDRAEELANKEGDKALTRAVRQKMHLELARAHVRAGDPDAAREEVAKGLKVKGGRECYHEDLESLRASL